MNAPFLNRITHPAYYNDFDEGACAWLEELMRHGLIAKGVVDRRSILDVRADDLREFTQCHFFAGIGGWSCALRLAGFPDERPVWTGSPPCQPFSTAGRQEGRADERHLAPHFVDLVGLARPGLLFGEQVASADVFGKAAKPSRRNAVPPPQWAWIDDLSDRLEAAHYTVGANDFSSAGIGAPHIRQRTYFGAVAAERMADLARGGWGQERPVAGWRRARDGAEGRAAGLVHGSEPQWLADMHGDGRLETGGCQPSSGRDGAIGDGTARGLVNSFGSGLEGLCGHGDRIGQPGRINPDAPGSVAEAGSTGEGRPGPVNGFWGTADWLFCRDERFRPVEPGTFPLANGIPERVGLLRGYGNAINPWAAKAFIEAFLETLETNPCAEPAASSGLDGLLI